VLRKQGIRQAVVIMTDDHDCLLAASWHCARKQSRARLRPCALRIAQAIVIMIASVVPRVLENLKARGDIALIGDGFGGGECQGGQPEVRIARAVAIATASAIMTMTVTAS